MDQDEVDREGRFAALEVLVGALLLQTVQGDAAQLAALRDGLRAPTPPEAAAAHERAVAEATQSYINNLIDRAIFAATRPRLVK